MSDTDSKWGDSYYRHQADTQLIWSTRLEAIYRHVWKLSTPEIAHLDVHFLLRTNPTTFLAQIDEETHDFRDLLHLERYSSTVAYEMIYLDTGPHLLEVYKEENKEKHILISMRANFSRNFAVGLVKVMDTLNEGIEKVSKELV